MVGFVAGDIKHSERLAWIATIGVLPEYRGRGIGAALLRACEEKMDVPVIRLVVRQSNDRYPPVRALRLCRVGHMAQVLFRWRRWSSDGEKSVIVLYSNIPKIGEGNTRKTRGIGETILPDMSYPGRLNPG